MTPTTSRLLVFLGCVVLGPLPFRLANDSSPNDTERIPAEIESNPGANLVQTPAILAKLRPPVIFIGDSMLNTRIDGKIFTAESGFKSAPVSRASSATAVWYLYLKNIIAPLKQKPKVVVLFFRDRYLTWPAYRTTGIYAQYLATLRQDSEPVLDRMLGYADAPPPSGARARLEHTIRRVYDFGNRPVRAHGEITDLALNFTSFGVEKKARRSRMALRFGLDNLRHDLPDDVGSEDLSWDSAESPLAFTPSPDDSFLPAMLDLAREHGFTLGFYRVKCRSDVEGTRLDDPHLKSYLAELAAFIEANGGFLMDESDDPIPHEWYSDGDHIGAPFRPDYTRMFWKKTRPILEPLLSGESP